MKTESIPVLVLFGPTASGKTNILLELFNSSGSLKGEVVSADSMQVYRGMDIGTAKPSPEERQKLPHHLIDIRDPSQQFNAGDFVRLADETCIQIASRGNLPVVSGGTGFYLKNFILGLTEAPPSVKEVREQIRIDLKEKGAEALRGELALFDPESAKRIHKNDEYRMLRALEVYRSCGKPLSSFHAKSQIRQDVFRFIIIGLSRSREELYSRINSRCEEMFKKGLEGEVRALYEAGYTPDDPGLRAIGYREFFTEETDESQTPDNHKKNRWRISQDIEGVKNLVAQNSRRYAKRQITFFFGIPGVRWIEAGGSGEIIKQIKKIINERESNPN